MAGLHQRVVDFMDHLENTRPVKAFYRATRWFTNALLVGMVIAVAANAGKIRDYFRDSALADELRGKSYHELVEEVKIMLEMS